MRGWLAIAASVVVLDQGSKWEIVRQLAAGQRVRLTGWLNLVLGYNRGAAFGFLSHAAGWQNLLFSAIAVAMTVFIVVTLWRLPRNQASLGWALALVLGGAIGNLLDRVRLGHVVDFIDFHIGHWHWYTFNVADSAISIGAVLLALDALGLFRRPGA